jgi:hypothetical protein
VLETVNSLKLTTNVELLSGVKEVLDTGVSVIVAAEDLLGLVDPVVSVLAPMPHGSESRHDHVLVRSVDILDSQDSKVSVVTEIAESDASTILDTELVDLGLVNIEVDRHGEEGAVSETVVLNDATRLC